MNQTLTTACSSSNHNQCVDPDCGCACHVIPRATLAFCPHSEIFPWVCLRFPEAAVPSCADFAVQSGSLVALVAHLQSEGVTEFRVVSL